VAQLGPAIPRIHALGATLVVVGSGQPFMAQAFKEDHPLDAPIYVDPTLKAHEAAGLKRSVARTLNFNALKAGVRAVTGGHMQGMTAGDPWQLGGTFVVVPGGKVVFKHISKDSADYPANDVVLKALESAKTN